MEEAGDISKEVEGKTVRYEIVVNCDSTKLPYTANYCTILPLGLPLQPLDELRAPPLFLYGTCCLSVY
jgi:hypothetical protein